MVVKITATFRGEDSLGYEYGRKYQLHLEGNTISRLDGTGTCPYESITAFLKNWTHISSRNRQSMFKTS